MLQAALLEHGRSGSATAIASQYGQKYEVRGMLQGPSGRYAAIMTVWIVLQSEEAPRLITAYPTDAL